MLRGGINEKAEIVQPMSRLGLTRMVGKVLRKQRSKMTGQDGQQGRRFIDEPTTDAQYRRSIVSASPPLERE